MPQAQRHFDIPEVTTSETSFSLPGSFLSVHSLPYPQLSIGFKELYRETSLIMSAPSLASYIIKRPWLKRWMTPLAEWYTNAAGYRRLGLR